MKRSQVYNTKSMKWKKGIKEMELPILQSGFVGLCDSCLTTNKNAKEELEKVKSLINNILYVKKPNPYFFDPDVEEDTCDYTEYEQLLHRILAVYQTNPSEELKKIMIQYTVIDMPEVRISMPHVAQYESVLKEISSVLPDDRITETLACLAKAQEIEDYFAKAFEEFGQGNYAYARELIAEESYQQIRDQFIAEDSGYWKGSVYIPVSREQMVLNNEDGKVTFSFRT